MNSEKLKKEMKKKWSNFKQNFLFSCKYRFNKIKEFIKENINKLPPISNYNSELMVIILFVAITFFAVAIVNNSNNELDTNDNDNQSVENQEIVIEPVIDEPKKETYVSLKVNSGGYNIYSLVSGKSGYRYGPSIIINDDGSLDAWYSSPGNCNEWDWITYMHSNDGKVWSNEKIVLQPTGDSYDHYSICDPGVIYFNDYYYLGYTSTIVSTGGGINNNIYVARSKNPDGPYEKWNGDGWGGKPAPIIYYDESDDAWGAGEISFVVANNQLYCYYTWNCEHGNYTRVATAKLTEDWPNTIKYQGIAYDKKYGQDSCDVVYLEEYKKFITYAISDRFSSNSGVIIYESNDGISFRRVDNIHSGISMYAHNMGISKRKDGHIKETDKLYISYAFSSSDNSRGKWATRFDPVELIIYEDFNRIFQDVDGTSTLRTNYLTNKIAGYISGINVDKKTININLNETKNISTSIYNQYRESSKISKGITYEYDESIIDIKGNTIHPINKGTSVVYVHYKDFYTTVTVNVLDKQTKSNEIVKFEPVEDKYVLYMNNDNYHTFQIRGYVEFENGEWGECYNDYTVNHPKYPSMIDAEKYKMSFEVQNENIVKVDEDGIIRPISIGETKIKVTMNDDLNFIVRVVVKP